MNKFLLIPILVCMVGGGLVAYGVVNSVTYTVNVHDTTTYAANIQLTTPTQIGIQANEGDPEQTSQITLHNYGNADGTATLSISGDLPAHFESGQMSIQVSVAAGQDASATLHIPIPSDVTGDQTYTVTVTLT